MPRIVHVTTFAASGGGMQSLVRRHRRRDPARGFSPEVIAIFEGPSPGAGDIGLRASAWTTVHSLRRRFVTKVGSRMKGAVAVYHNGWGMPLFAPGDGAERRLALLHTDRPGFERFVRAIAPWCDGLLCVNGQIADKARLALPAGELPAIVLPLPVEPPNLIERRREQRSQPRVGYVGRLVRHQKRVERLPELAAALGAVSDWMIIGDGPERHRLEQKMRARAQVEFRGWLEGADYWAALRELDAIVFTSDFEGTPLALMEAMVSGAVPLFPAIGGEGETMARSVDARCVYPPGDIAVAGRQLRELLANRQTLAGRARLAVAAHTPAAYELAYNDAIVSALERPRISREQHTRTTRWSDWMPMFAVARFYESAIWS